MQGLAQLVLDRATTVSRYPLVVATDYNIPVLLARPGTGHRVTGQVYQVDHRMLQHLGMPETTTVFEFTITFVKFLSFNSK